MSRYRAILIKLEELDGTVIEQKWAMYDSERRVSLPDHYNFPSDAEREATTLNNELEAANVELFQNIKGFTDDPENPTYKQ
ncbi:hypothetical protein QZP89_19290 [Citrobacter werkmanii]|uniref:hypothetical protein n=1 Tax=Citrobacter werkmanii TaxID=67827 RepID=UPI00264FE7A3|nr:hypothetical protein [Citrobacter werkmanii]MDN8553951.1 hypothetical protein [Citrobacter werkmanii]